jgi:hypothetical protein
MESSAGKAINTFTKGMNKDTDYSIIPKEAYLDASNFHLITNKGNSSGSLEVIEGNSLVDNNTPSTHKIIGYCNVREDMVIFSTDNASSRIAKVTTSDGNLLNYTVLYDDTSMTNKLNFNLSHKIKAIGRYETTSIRKVYFVDNYNPIRFFSIDNLLANPTQDVSKFDIIPDCSILAPVFNSYINGNLTAGKIQYAYQLFDNNGAETLFSSASKLIALTTAKTSGSSNIDFKGTSIDVNTFKGVNFTILVSAGFTKIRIISIKYNSLNAIPVINIVTEQDISIDGGLYSFNDYGENYLGSYTYEEFAIIGRYVFKAKELETKNDYLFVGNVSNIDWDITYDARAYRFGPFSYSTALIYSSNLFDTIGVTTSNYADVPTNHDCINYWKNDITNDNTTFTTSSLQYQYQADHTTLGGEGIHLKYEFIYDTITIDNTIAGNETHTAFTDYSNPYVDINLVGYQRDEIYRFGIVFFNKKGINSSVKWIGDIRFPTYSENIKHVSSGIVTEAGIANPVLDSSSNITRIDAKILGIRFWISGLGEAKAQGAEYYQIVRCKRESLDRTVLAQGLVSNTIVWAGDTTQEYQVYQTPTAYRPSVGIIDINDVVEFISPEINFNKNLTYVNNDRLDVIGGALDVQGWNNKLNTPITSSTSMIVSDGSNFSASLKYHRIESAFLEYTRQRINVTLTTIVDYVNSDYDVAPVIDINRTIKFKNWTAENSFIRKNFNPSGTKAILTLDTSVTINTNSLISTCSINNVNYTIHGSPVVNYRRPTVQYGGNSYSNRLVNTYIVCSEIKTIGSLNTIITDVFGGDTYIGMYDYLRNIVWDGRNPNRTQLDLLFPVETSIDLVYRQDKCFSKIPADFDFNKQYLTEKAGVYGDTSTRYIFTQPGDLYVYNSVYSQENITKKFYLANPNIQTNQTYDTRVINSNKKINGELTDNWTIFKLDNFIDVDSTYGKLNILENYNNTLYFWQDKGFGALSVNTRSLISDNSTSQLVLGTGGVLDRYDYIDNSMGSISQFGLITGKDGLYWYDTLNNVFCKYKGSVESLSKIKGIQSYLNNFGDQSTICIGVPDNKYTECIFTLINGNNQKVTFAYNEIIGAFTSTYSYLPTVYLSSYDQHYYTTKDNNEIYLHNNGTVCNFYSITSPSHITFIVNDNFHETKIFGNLEYETKSLSYTITGNINNYYDTFNTLAVYNTKQHSGNVSIVTNNSTIGYNTSKKENTFVTMMPRNIVTTSSIYDVDVQSPSNWNTSRLFKEKMRDKYIIVSLTYNNSTNKNLSLPFVVTNYIGSKR